MLNGLLLKIITPEKTAYESNVESVTVMTESGEITVLPGHIPLVTTIIAGELHARRNGESVPFALGQGVLGVSNDEVKVLVNTTEIATEIDLQRAQEAIRRAHQAMESAEHMIDVEFADMQARIERNLNRIKIGNKWRK